MYVIAHKELYVRYRTYIHLIYEEYMLIDSKKSKIIINFSIYFFCACFPISSSIYYAFNAIVCLNLI